MHPQLNKVTIMETLVSLLGSKLGQEDGVLSRRKNLSEKIDHIFEGAGHKVDIHDSSVNDGIMQASIALVADSTTHVQYKVANEFLDNKSFFLQKFEKIQAGSLFCVKEVASDKRTNYFVVPNGILVQQIKLDEGVVICIPESHKLMEKCMNKSYGDTYEFAAKTQMIVDIQ